MLLENLFVKYFNCWYVPFTYFKKLLVFVLKMVMLFSPEKSFHSQTLHPAVSNVCLAHQKWKFSIFNKANFICLKVACCHIPYVALHCRDLDFSLAHQFHKIVISYFLIWYSWKKIRNGRLNLSCVKMWPLEFQQDVAMANLDGFKRRPNKFMKGVSIKFLEDLMFLLALGYDASIYHFQKKKNSSSLSLPQKSLG